MKIYPAIDLKSGLCVRLRQGSYENVTIYERDPVLQAQLFEAEGAEALHIVDLDGAKAGKSMNLDIIRQIATKTNLEIQVGGGIRTLDQLNHIFKMGIPLIFAVATRSVLVIIFYCLLFSIFYFFCLLHPCHNLVLYNYYPTSLKYFLLLFWILLE